MDKIQQLQSIQMPSPSESEYCQSVVMVKANVYVSCKPNVKQIIDGHNKNILKKAAQPQKRATAEEQTSAH